MYMADVQSEKRSYARRHVAITSFNNVQDGNHIPIANVNADSREEQVGFWLNAKRCTRNW